MSDSSGKFEVGESLYDKENKYYIPLDGDSDMEYFLDGRDVLDQSEGQSQPIEEIIQQSEAPSTENDQVVYLPPIMDDQPLAKELLTPDSKSHYITEETWKEKDDAKEWSRERGNLIMCIIVCNSSTSDISFQMVCECSGQHRSHAKKDTLQVAKKKRKNTTFSKKTRCPFKLQFKKNAANKWFLEKVVCGSHNHPIPESLLSHAYVGRLTQEEEKIVESLSQILMKPVDILAHLKERNPQNASTLDNIYNERKKLKAKKWEQRNEMQQLRNLGELHNYSVFHDDDDKGRIRHILLANPKFVKLARCSHQVLLMDCTYKTKKFEMSLLNIVGQTSTNAPFSVGFCFLKYELEESYVWALEQVKLFYVEGYTPKVIITDKEQALLNAIRRVFPEAHNILCTLHLWKSIETKCMRLVRPTRKSEMDRIKELPLHKQDEAKEKFKNDDKLAELKWESFKTEWRALTYFITVDEYEDRARMLVAHWKRGYPSVVKYLFDNWLDPHKYKFVSAFTNQYRHYDNQATSTAESSHNRLKKKLHSCNGGLVMLFEAMHSYFLRDHDRVTEYFEKSRSKHHTKWIDNEWLRGITHQVSHKAIEKIMYEVNYELGDYEEECVCPNMTSLGLPCRHVITTYQDKVIPIQDVDPFWQQLTFRETIFDPKFGGTFADTEIGQALAEKYATLSQGQRKIWLSNLRKFVYPQFRYDIKEPPKGKGKGRPPNKKKRYVGNKKARELAEESKKRDPCGYEWLRKEYEAEDELEEDDVQGRNKRKIGQADKGEPSYRNVQQKCIDVPTQESATSKIDVKGKGPIFRSKQKERSKVVVQGNGRKESGKNDDGVKGQGSYVGLEVSSQDSSIKRLIGKVGVKQLARNNGKSLMVEKEKEMIHLKGVPKPPPRDKNGRYSRNQYILYEYYLRFSPDYIRGYIKAIEDVDGDGNCGYHVFVDQLGPFEDALGWDCEQVTYVRKKCLMELRAHRDFYKPMMRVERNEINEVLNESFKEMERRLTGNICLTRQYWMRMPICGQQLANAFNYVIHLISGDMSTTFAPTRIPFDEDLSIKKTVVMGHVEGIHYIGLQLHEGSPLPPLWREFGCDGELPKAWCNLFEKMIELWKAIMLSMPKKFVVMTDDEEDS